jgi:hypothetical protein
MNTEPVRRERIRCVKIVETELLRETDEVVKSLLRRIINEMQQGNIPPTGQNAGGESGQDAVGLP